MSTVVAGQNRALLTGSSGSEHSSSTPGPAVAKTRPSNQAQRAADQRTRHALGASRRGSQPEDLQNRLWPAGTYVDFEHSVNAAIKRLRQALGDSADSPRFIETLARNGYRFIAPVSEPIDDLAEPAGQNEIGMPQPAAQEKAHVKWRRFRALPAVMAGILRPHSNCRLRGRSAREAAGSRRSGPIRSLAVLPLANLSRRPR